ncbi:PAS domain S-box protein [Roseomonas sp. KE2513]|uniref:PAS domain S-box protein n=1 Tax=Roseomonas sp. KE2513 TaxID=2479202 RepID=UPI0018DFB62A|nr:PAS domain S-box protein [Roseomonas sp. KE2513]MBI0535846.1 PAS domain S-box protein [Roseomonas sp. KE2513]
MPAEPCTLALTPEIESLLAARLSTGAYRDSAEVIRAALLAMDPAGSPEDAAFRLLLEDQLRIQSDAGAAMACAAAMLGAHLRAARAGYGEVDAQAGTMWVERDWTDGQAVSLGGQLRRLEGFGQALVAEIRAGRTVVVEDCATDPRTDGAQERASWSVLGTRALIAAPLLKAGVLHAILYVHANRPRRWFAAEVDLLRQVAERTQETVARARAEAALRESEARHRVLFESAPFSVIVIDPATHKVLEVNEHACATYGYSREEFTRLNIADIDALGQTAAIREQGRAGTIRPGLQEFEARHRTRTGEVRDVLVRAQGLRLAGRDLTYGAHFDITDRKAAEAALRASEARLRLTVEAARLSTWEFDLRHGTGSRAGPLMSTLPQLPPGDFPLERWLEAMHPEERDDVEARFWAVVRGESPRFEAEFRVRRPGGEWAWVSSFGAVVERDAATGAALRVAGVAQDITERRAAEQRRALLMREVDHRAKNALAVVQAMLRLTRAEDLETYRHTVVGRVAAIARAQTLLAEDRWSGADLRALLQGELQSFLGGEGQRARLEGPPVTLPAGATQPFAMAVHELATNATKHGALGVPGGQLSITWDIAEGPNLRLRWAEAGGPPLPGTPDRRGFGSRVLEGTVNQQLGGSVSLSWAKTGLVCDIVMPLPLGG